MALREHKGFVRDSRATLTTRQKNSELSAKLALAPWVGRRVVSIQRVEIAAKGWFVFYRTA